MNCVSVASTLPPATNLHNYVTEYEKADSLRILFMLHHYNTNQIHLVFQQ